MIEIRRLLATVALLGAVGAAAAATPAADTAAAPAKPAAAGTEAAGMPVKKAVAKKKAPMHHAVKHQQGAAKTPGKPADAAAPAKPAGN